MDAEEELNAKLEDQLRFETLLTDISARCGPAGGACGCDY